MVATRNARCAGGDAFEVRDGALLLKKFHGRFGYALIDKIRLSTVSYPTMLVPLLEVSQLSILLLLLRIGCWDKHEILSIRIAACGR